jgi:hypothetical protein
MDETRPFDEWFREHRKGQSVYEAGEVLRELVAAVANTGKKGSMTLKIDVTPEKQFGMSAVVVSDEITAKLPTPEKDSSLFFIDGQYDLVRHDPRQMSIHDPEE